MNEREFDTLAEAVNALTKEGYKDDFEAREDHFYGNYSKRKYLPRELRILAHYRFEGETDPEDAAILFAIETADGTKGTFIMSYSAQHNQNEELIQHVPVYESGH